MFTRIVVYCIEDNFDYYIVVKSQEHIYNLGSINVGDKCKAKYIENFALFSFDIFKKRLKDLITNDGYNIDDKQTSFLKRKWKTQKILKVINKSLNNNKEEIPFLEIICSDNGLIGPEVCKKLYKDFIKYDDKAKNILDDDFYKNYEMFKNYLKIKKCILHIITL